MIRYTLTCDKGHSFESWFASSGAFDSLQKAGHVACAHCGSAKVERALMAPSLRTARAAAAEPEPAKELSQPKSDVERELAALRKQVEENSDYVGLSFAAEARKMHEGNAPARAIYGEANTDEARKLIEDGVPVAPLPFMPRRKTN